MSTTQESSDSCKPQKAKQNKQKTEVKPFLTKQESAKSRRFFSPQMTLEKSYVSPEKRASKKPYVIGICGGPSSGKSTVATMLKRQIPDARILNLINYYYPVRGNLRRRSSAFEAQEMENKLSD